jgi:tetratricopeptide (TPR) repeat protein
MVSASEQLPVAFGYHQAGNLLEAERLYREILREQPNCAPAWHFLGLIAHQARQYDQAVREIQHAVELIPNYVEAHQNLAVVLHDSGRYAEATRSFQRVLQLQPHNAEVYDLLGLAHYLNGDPDAALSSYQRAIELEPTNASAYNHLGILHSDLGNAEQAVACYRRAIQLRPNFVEACTNLGLALTDLERYEEAIACHFNAIELQPQRAELFSNLGGAFEKQGDLDRAVGYYRRAIELQPDLAEAYVNLGNVQSEQGQWQDAAESYHRALQLRANYPDAHTGLAALLLYQGDLASGWSEYEWRWQCKRLRPRPFPQPLWDGSPPGGKTILIHAEQGLGDTFQFIRYLPLVKAQGATVILEVQKPLVQLLANTPGVDRLIAAGGELPAFDFYAPLLSLPRIFRTTLETIPAQAPYLFADQALVQHWREKLHAVGGFRIGVNWHGRSGRGAHRQRDVPSDCIARLAEVPGLTLVNLQRGELRQELARRCDPQTLVDLGADIDGQHGAFMDTAAIMMNLDLVISSDTSIPHLAGALGVPVWLALPFAPNWRWLRLRTDCPWYPTMRLFRQPASGNWNTVFAAIHTELRQLIAAAE